MKRRHGRGAFTLAELIVASAVSTCIMAGLMAGAMALQRGYSAAQYQLECQEDEARVMDSIVRDLRRATSVTISNQNRLLALTLPDQVDSVTSTLRLPAIVNGAIQYGTVPVAVSYYVSGTAFMRNENGVETVISTNPAGLENFFIYNDTPGANPPLLRFTLCFVPRFSRQGGVDPGAATRCSSVVRLRNKANVVVL